MVSAAYQNPFTKNVTTPTGGRLNIENGMQGGGMEGRALGGMARRAGIKG